MKFITSVWDDAQILVDDKRDISICWSGWDSVSIETPDNYMTFVASKVTLHEMEQHFAPKMRTHINDVRCMGCGVIIKNCDDYYAQCDACFDKMVDGGYGSH